MIYDTLQNLGKYRFDDKNMEIAREFLLKNDLLSMEHKKYVLIEDEIYINPLNIDQKPLAEREYEAHNHFVDIHVTLEGLDFIRSTQKTNLEITSPYDEKGDYEMGTYEGDAYTDSQIPRGYFGLYFPEDAHLVNGTPGKPGTVRKFVVKVKVK